MSRRKITGGRAVVTGASSGIGRAIALELARGGADVLVVARREERLRAVVDEIVNLGRRGAYVAGDITQDDTRARVIDTALKTFGGLDILVNNAGVAAMGPFEQADPQRLRRIMELNFFAAVEMIRIALPVLRQGNKPIVCNIGSVLGHVGLPNLSEYSASKFALRGFSEVLRAETLTSGLDVLYVGPATVDTEIWDRMIEDSGDTSWRQARGATPATIARKTVKAIRRGSASLSPGLIPKSVNLVNRLFPGVVQWALAHRH